MNKKFLAVTIVLVFLFSSISVLGADTGENHIDAVLVVDLSGSMGGNDPGRIAIEGVKLFIDMMEYNGSRVAVLGFESSLHDISGGFKEINTFQDKSELLRKIDDLSYRGSTDMGMALKEAEALLFRRQNQRQKPIVVLFTDGYVEVSASSNRTDTQSLAEIQEVLLGAANNYPIYTIGLNGTTRVDSELLTEISEKTGARTYMTNNPKDLPEIFNDIFARHIKSNVISLGTLKTDGQNYNSVDISIPNSSVIEANIVLLTGNPIIDARLTNPAGIELSLTGNNNIYFSKSNYYSMIKIISPERGTWKLSLMGVSGDEVKVNLLYSYNIELEASFADTNAKKGDNVTVIGRLTNQGVDLQDADLLSEFNAEMEVYDQSGNLTAKMPMSNMGLHLEADYVLPSVEGDYTFILKAAGVGFYRESEPIVLSVSNLPVENTESIPNITMFSVPFINDTYEVRLGDYFIDPDDNDTTYNISSEGNASSFEIKDDSILYIKSNKILMFGRDEFLVRAFDTSGSYAEAVFTLRIIPLCLFILFGFVLALFVIAVIVLQKTFKERNRLLKGRIRCVGVKDGIDMSSPIKTELALFKGRVSVDKFVGAEELSEFPELNKITFIQAEGRYALNFTNNSPYAVTNLTKLDKNFILNQGETISILNSENTVLRFTYL